MIGAEREIKSAPSRGHPDGNDYLLLAVFCLLRRAALRKRSLVSVTFGHKQTSDASRKFGAIQYLPFRFSITVNGLKIGAERT